MYMEKRWYFKVILNKTPIHGKDVRSHLPGISLGSKINVTGVVAGLFRAVGMFFSKKCKY